MSRLENLKLFEGSISGNLANVSFSLWWRLVISIIHWKNVLLGLAVPACQGSVRKGKAVYRVGTVVHPAGIKLFE